MIVEPERGPRDAEGQQIDNQRIRLEPPPS